MLTFIAKRQTGCAVYYYRELFTSRHRHHLYARRRQDLLESAGTGLPPRFRVNAKEKHRHEVERHQRNPQTEGLPANSDGLI